MMVNTVLASQSIQQAAPGLPNSPKSESPPEASHTRCSALALLSKCPDAAAAAAPPW